MTTSTPLSHNSGSAEHIISTSQFSDLNIISPDAQSAYDLPTFKYTHLDAGKPEIRLLTLLPGTFPAKIECKLHDISLEDKATSYEALSYTRGDPTPVKVLSLNGLQTRIAVNLYTALLHLRDQNSPRVLWIDAICINQHDVQEKNHQVKQMAKIYRRAEQVIAWLGEEVQDTHSAIVKLKEIANIGVELIYWDDRKKMEIYNELKSCKNTWAANLDIIDRPYWRRAWIIQELTGTEDATVLCGQHAIPWSSLREAQNCITSIFFNREDLSDTGLAHLGLLAGQPDWNSEGARDRSIADHIAQFINCKVTNPLDRIYAFSGLPCREDMSDFQVDYELSEEKLLETFAKWHIFKTRTLDILAYACPTIASKLDGQVKLRTKWVPDWENRYVKPLTWLPIAKNIPVYHTSGDTKVDDFLYTLSAYTPGPTLPCFGFEIDQVKEVGDVLTPAVGEDAYDPYSPLMQQWESMMTKLYLQRNPYSSKGIDTSDFQYYTVSKSGANSALQTFSLPSNIEPERLALIEAYWRTLIGDRWENDPRIPIESVPRHRADRSVWRYWADWHDGVRQPDVRGLKLFRTSIVAVAMNRRFVLTENNYMGLAPKMAEVGDRICVFLGGQTPYVVRKKSEVQSHQPSIFGADHFLGDAYVHGMMDGEAMKKYSTGEKKKKFFLLL